MHGVGRGIYFCSERRRSGEDKGRACRAKHDHKLLSLFFSVKIVNK